LLECNIQSNLGAQSLDCLQYFKEKYDLSNSELKNSQNLYRHGLVLPLYGKLEAKDINYVSQVLIEYLLTQ
jgi:dTDP-4-amino-4,6-dideoxygalactose transaminase